MNRRYFLKSLSMVAAGAALAAKAVSQTTDDRGEICVTQNDQKTREIDLDAPLFHSPLKPLFKITSVNRRGAESMPVAVEVNSNGHIHFAPVRDAVQYALYAPKIGFPRLGPWYLLRVMSAREAKRARYTIVAPHYTDRHLLPKLAPHRPTDF